MQVPYYFCIVHNFLQNDIQVSFTNTTVSCSIVLVQFNDTVGSFLRKLWPFESLLLSLLSAIGGPSTDFSTSLCPYLLKYQSEICIDSHCVLGGGNVIELEGNLPCFLHIMNLQLQGSSLSYIVYKLLFNGSLIHSSVTASFQMAITFSKMIQIGHMTFYRCHLI